MKEEEIFYMLAMQAVEGIGPVNAKKLLDHFGSAKQLFQGVSHPSNLPRQLRTKMLNRFKDKRIFNRAEKEMRFIESQKLTAVGFNDTAYPEKLRHCNDAPLLLFQKGSFNINKKRILSIVGTRMMTPYGSRFLKDFVSDIKAYDPIIISGLAYGIDICAHREALRNDICTVAVLAHGLDMVYPRTHTNTIEKMYDNGGVYSEFWSGSGAEKVNFIKRNRIIAGISEATLVVESAYKGGSLVTAGYAASYHRDVLALPGRTTDKFSEGCNMLIKSNKAAMVTSAKDLEYALGWSSGKPTRSVQQKLFVSLDKEEKQVYDQLDLTDKKMLDQVSVDCGLSVQRTLTLLLQLELKGKVMSYPGKLYKGL